jgi:hypothetical protein
MNYKVQNVIVLHGNCLLKIKTCYVISTGPSDVRYNTMMIDSNFHIIV